MKKKFFCLPFIVFAFSAAVGQNRKEKLQPPPPPEPPKADIKHFPPPPPPIVTVKHFPPPLPDLLPDDYKNFLERNPEVKGLGWTKNGHVVRVYSKDGKMQSFSLEKEEDVKKFNVKYGELPVPPSPPPVDKN